MTTSFSLKMSSNLILTYLILSIFRLHDKIFLGDNNER